METAFFMLRGLSHGVTKVYPDNRRQVRMQFGEAKIVYLHNGADENNVWLDKPTERACQAMSVTNSISAGERGRHWHGSPDTNIAQRGVHHIVHDHAGLIFIVRGKKQYLQYADFSTWWRHIQFSEKGVAFVCVEKAWLKTE